MRLAPRLFLAFGLVSAISTAGLGFVVRQDRAHAEKQRFEQDVVRACQSAREELRRQAEADRRLVAGACQRGELTDRVAISIERGAELAEMQLGYKALVPSERQAFGFDELMLATGAGDVIGVDPPSLLRTPRGEIERVLREGAPTRSWLRVGDVPALVSRCVTQTPKAVRVGLIGARHIKPQLERLSTVLRVGVSLGPLGTVAPEMVGASCSYADGQGADLTLAVTRDTHELEGNLRKIDRAVMLAALASLGLALLLAVWLARSLGRPIAELADEARKVAAGEARPLRVRGKGEIADLAQAFERMLADLDVMRRRLAATSRVAAWREVARRVAHEVKNPLAPIRAAVETLRRLRARQDPAFDDYFDEATRTVLDEVHRISNIVTEFTRFARLPPPNPETIDVEEVARHVVQLHRPSTEDVTVELVVRRPAPPVRADRDQIVQVLTNLVQNAIDAARRSDGSRGLVRVAVDGEPGYAWVTVADDGPGVAPEIAGRLFEPYATTKSAGTGLGLAIAQRIAIEHNGELAHLGSTDGRGATFRLVLPVSGPSPESVPSSDTPTPLV